MQQYYKNKYMIALVERDEEEFIRYMGDNVRDLAIDTGLDYQHIHEVLAHKKDFIMVGREKFRIQLIKAA